MALLDLDAPDFPAPPSSPASALHDLVLAEDKTWHSWKEFGEHAHYCTCGAPESHHNHLLALSRGET